MDVRQTLTIEQVAAILGISRASAYAAAREGAIPVLRLGRRFVVPKAAFQRMLDGEAEREAELQPTKALERAQR